MTHDIDNNTRQLWVPVVGDLIRVMEPWNIQVMYESRNAKFLQKVEGPEADKITWRCREIRFHDFVVPAGTVLGFDRIYTRRGSEEFNSVTFRVQECPEDKRLKGQRFWVKVALANQLRYEPVDRAPFDQAREARAQKTRDKRKYDGTYSHRVIQWLKESSEMDRWIADNKLWKRDIGVDFSYGWRVRAQEGRLGKPEDNVVVSNYTINIYLKVKTGAGDKLPETITFVRAEIARTY